MQKKIGTLLDDKLLTRTKAYCHRKNLPISRVLNDALQDYLKKEDAAALLTLSGVRSSFGAFKVSKANLQKILEEDIYET